MPILIVVVIVFVCLWTAQNLKVRKAWPAGTRVRWTQKGMVKGGDYTGTVVGYSGGLWAKVQVDDKDGVAGKIVRAEPRLFQPVQAPPAPPAPPPPPAPPA